MHLLCTCLCILVIIWENILIIFIFLFFILVVLVKTVYLHPRNWLGEYEQLIRKLVLEKEEAWSVSSQYNSVQCWYFKVVIPLSAGRMTSVIIIIDADITLRVAHLHINRLDMSLLWTVLLLFRDRCLV